MALGRSYPRFRRSVLSGVGCLCTFLDATSRRSYATRGSVRRPGRLGHRGGAELSPRSLPAGGGGLASSNVPAGHCGAVSAALLIFNLGSLAFWIPFYWAVVFP